MQRAPITEKGITRTVIRCYRKHQNRVTSVTQVEFTLTKPLTSETWVSRVNLEFSRNSKPFNNYISVIKESVSN